MYTLNSLIKKTVQNSILNHVLFWALSFYILLNVFSNNSVYKTIDYLYTGIFLFTLVIPVLMNLYLLIPLLLLKKRYLVYIFCISLFFFGFSYFNYLLFNKLIDYIFPEYYFISYYDYVDILKFFTVFLILTSLLKLSKEWFQLIEFKQKVSVIEKEKIEIELKALRSQVNPHFLFNSLNVLYSLALKKSIETPEIIIKLSDILRYVIYDANKEKISLKSEVELIKNYLSLQNHRIDDSSKIVFNTNIQNEIQIAPMLFLPLVENSFKHGIKGDILDTYVKINLTVNNNELYFEIENNKGITDTSPDKTEGGIGLSNIKKRLELLYPNKHTFKVIEDDKNFKVSLKINYEN